MAVIRGLPLRARKRASTEDFRRVSGFTGPTSEIYLPLMPSKPKAVRFNDLDGVLVEVKTVDWGE
jgi:hypothetical protein